MKEISEIPIGHTFNSPKHGEGMIIAKTRRSLTAQFKTGTKVKLTYRNSDDYFYPSDF